MSACDTCPKPGACCKGFPITAGGRLLRFSPENWRQEAAEKMEQHGLPFVPLRVVEKTEEIGGSDVTYCGKIVVQFACPKLTASGRCGDYENRPQLCRDYQPGQDPMCALHVAPAIVEAAP